MAATGVWASSSRGHQAPHSAMSPSGVPANPFARTLASLEPQEKDTDQERTTAERAAPGNNRASLDVESFKNLLMTGKPGPGPSGLSQQSTTIPSSVPSGPQFESSSSTDTSSISRQSLFEQPQQIHAESPRTSFEMPESEEDESMGVVSEAKKGKKKPPPAPKHRHGKLVTQRQPQTVSFDSFAASEPAIPPVTVTEDSSNANKPLPPTPIVSPPPLHVTTQDASQQRPPPVQQHSSESLLRSDSTRSQKRAPPPVPLARRQSQLRSSTTGNRSRSNSNLTISSQHSVEPPLLSPTPSTKETSSIANVKSPPPPPRSRHGARLTDLPTSSPNSSSSELPQRSNSTRSGPSSSRRSTIEAESEPASPIDIRRTSSISSNRNSRIVSNESASSQTMPPPPPPPRRRQSGRSSLDQQRPIVPSSPAESRRTSAEMRRTSTENRRTSVASEMSLRPVDEHERVGDEFALQSPTPLEKSEAMGGLGAAADQGSVVEAGASNDILDDMEKFQREIEELRRKYTKAK
jgi:hypothetical protein